MAKHVLNFYLLAMLLGFMITLWTGSRGAPLAEVFAMTLLAWPAAFFVLLARDRAERIRLRSRRDD